MTFKVHKWNDIKHEFKNSTLLIGNGASIALDSNFSYSSLKEFAEEHGDFEQDVLQLFKAFQTDDFELILRLVWHATIINEKLNVHDKKTKEAYENIRQALINTVRNIHSEYHNIEVFFPLLYKFTKNFKTIISLNYDLIMYWIIMYGNSQRDEHKFKDCFTEEGRRFKRDWKELRKYYRENENTLIFYPHGNLCLARNIFEEEFKISAGYNRYLLDSILSEWKSGSAIPLFISEGTKEKKLKSIGTSSYLSIVFNEVLPKIFRMPWIRNEDENNLVIYGWSLGEHDEHILKQILNPVGNSSIRNMINRQNNKIAISLYNPNQSKCFEMMEKIKKILGQKVIMSIYFFDSQDAGCWNNPE